MEMHRADHGYPYHKLQALKGLLGTTFTALHLRAAHIIPEEVSVFEDFAVELRSATEVTLLHLANGWFTPPNLPGLGHLNLTLRTFDLAQIQQRDTPSDARAEYDSVTRPLGVRYAGYESLGVLEEIQVNEGHEDRHLHDIDPHATPSPEDPAAFDIRSVASIALLFASGTTLLITSDEARVTLHHLPHATPDTKVNGFTPKIESIRVSAIAS